MEQQTDIHRCEWARTDPLLRAYHDTEWGVPEHEDRKLFEFLVLESAQAGLSWLTVLKKRENYRKAFDGFDPERVARYGEEDIARLLADAGIIRNRAKIVAAIGNARVFLEIQKAYGSFDRYMWQFVGGHPLKNSWQAISDLPARTHISDALSLDLRARGFRFFGSTICYAHIQAVGMVNDHTVECFRHDQVGSKECRV